MNVTPYGDRAVRVELAGLDTVHDFAAAVRNRDLAGVVDVVPSWTSVLVTYDRDVTVAEVCAELVGVEPAGADHVERAHVIPVRYVGDDLPRVAEQAGIATTDVIARHTAGRYTVAFLGFVPGFGYLSGLDPSLATPRLPTPRPAVAAGSVAIADDVTAVYPAVTPGGWNVIGVTALALFDADLDQPSLLMPGDQVRFEAV